MNYTKMIFLFTVYMPSDSKPIYLKQKTYASFDSSQSFFQIDCSAEHVSSGCQDAYEAGLVQSLLCYVDISFYSGDQFLLLQDTLLTQTYSCINKAVLLTKASQLCVDVVYSGSCNLSGEVQVKLT